LDEAVGEGGFAVVNMGHDGEIADMCEIGHGEDMRLKRDAVKRGRSARAPKLVML